MKVSITHKQTQINSLRWWPFLVLILILTIIGLWKSVSASTETIDPSWLYQSPELYIEPLGSQWQSLSSLPNDRAGVSATSNGKYIYVSGGAQGVPTYAHVYVTSINQNGSLNAWLPTTNLPSPRVAHASVVHSGNLYVIGGYERTANFTGGRATVYRASIQEDGYLGTWSTETPLPTDLYRLTAFSYGQWIYAIGGYSDTNGSARQTILRSLVNSDGTLGQWISVAFLPNPLHGHGQAIVNNRIYVIGGMSGLSQSTMQSIVYSALIEQDGTFGNWIQVASLPQPLYQMGVWTYGDQIVVGGGRTEPSGGDVSTVYATIADLTGTLQPWWTETPLPRTLCCFGAVTGEYSLYAINGASEGIGSSADVYGLSHPLGRMILSIIAPPPPAISGFTWPLDDPNSKYLGYTSSDSHCGGIHHAKDFFVAHPNSPSEYPKIYAVADGKVIFSDVQANNRGYGSYIVIWHEMPNGEYVYSLYAHLLPDSLRVVPGQLVRRGDWIAQQDTSGTGANSIEHLHFELRKFGTFSWAEMTPQMRCPATEEIADQYYYDPLEFIPGHWWENLTPVEMVTKATSTIGEQSFLYEDVISPGGSTGQIAFTISDPGPAHMAVALAFPGSELEIILYQPDGSVYNTFQTSDPPLLTVVTNPTPGEWAFSVQAMDVPQSNYPFAVSVGLRDTPLEDVGEIYDSDPAEGYTGDLAAPTTTLSVIPSSPSGQSDWYTSTISITLSATDNSAGVAETRYRLNHNQDPQLYSGSIPLSNEGANIFAYYSVDGLGNLEFENTTIFYIDLTAPELNVSGTYTISAGGEITLTASGTDLSGYPLVYIWDLDNDGTFETQGQNVVFSAMSIFGPSNHTVSVQVMDDAGHVSVAQTTVVVERDGPANIIVNTIADTVDVAPGNGICADSTNECSLRAAIMEANALPGLDIITLSAAIYELSIPGINENGAATGDLDIGDSLIIIGAGTNDTVIDANGIDRVFDIGTIPGQPVELKFQNLTITGGDAGYLGLGGGIFNSGRVVELVEVHISGNTATYGGGVYNPDGEVTIANSTIANNSAFEAGGLYNINGSVTISNSVLANNSATMVAGGIFNSRTNLQSTALLTITNSTIISNSSLWRGGGIYNNQGTVNIINSAIVNNSSPAANGDGAGAFNQDGSMTLTHSAVLTNTAGLNGGGIFNINEGGYLTLIDSVMSGNAAGDAGGAIFNYLDATVTLSNTVLAQNSAAGLGLGGGGIFSNLGTQVIIKSSTLSQNSTNGKGGALANYPTAGNVTMEQSTVIGNIAGQEGGGLYMASGTLEVSESLIHENQANLGGGIYSLSTLNAHYSEIINNVATITGGALYNAGQGLAIVENSCIADNSSVSIYNDSAATHPINAVSNWWGHVDGPSGEGDGSGDDISLHVLYSPFLTSVAPNCTIINMPPVVTANGPYTISEGTVITLTATASDPEGGSLSYAWDLNGDGIFETPGQTVSFSAANLAGPGMITIAVQVTDSGGLTTVDQTSVTIHNAAPVVGDITASTYLAVINTFVQVATTFTDIGLMDTHTAVWSWGDGTTSAGTVVESNGTGAVTGGHTYFTPGIYTVRVTVTDDDGAAAESILEFIVVYNPNGGHLTGAGAIDSPMGAYAANLTLTGPGNFGMYARYVNGVLTGKAQYSFPAANLLFRSTSFDWLVVNGDNAVFRGQGTINDSGHYGFAVTVYDGKNTGTTDRYRIRIWDMDNGNMEIYDNGFIIDNESTQAISSGNIYIHH